MTSFIVEPSLDGFLYRLCQNWTLTKEGEIPHVDDDSEGNRLFSGRFFSQNSSVHVVNLDYVSRVCGNGVEMCTGELLDVGLPYKNLLWDTLNVVALGKRYEERRNL